MARFLVGISFVMVATGWSLAAPARPLRSAEACRELEDLSTTVRWRTDYGEARKESERTGNPLVIVVTKIHHVLWCEWMLTRMDESALLVRFLNSKTVPLKVEVSKAQNVRTAEALGIIIYPTTIIADPEGKILDTRLGCEDPEKLLSALEKMRANGGLAK